MYNHYRHVIDNIEGFYENSTSLMEAIFIFFGKERMTLCKMYFQGNKVKNKSTHEQLWLR